jgi:DNA-binding transcriptional regulator YhcF (GntR family)
MFLKINPSSGVPITRQIVDGVKYLVASGRLKAGDRIPGVRDLAREAGINPTTVVRSYTQLEHEGIIYMRQGQGTFINGAPPDLTREQKERKVALLARLLAVEGVNLGLTSQRIGTILEEELRKMTEGGRKL